MKKNFLLKVTTCFATIAWFLAVARIEPDCWFPCSVVLCISGLWLIAFGCANDLI